MGFVLGLLIWTITIASVVLTVGSGYHMPVVISRAGAMIDHQFGLTMAITGVAFILAQGLLGLFVLQYRDRPGRTARYIHGNTTVEAAGAIIVGAVFITLAVMGQKVWADLHLAPAPGGSIPIEITGEQFAWNVRYPGPDGQFGRTSPTLYDPIENQVGIDPADPAGKDDFVLLNNLVVPVGKPVELRLRTKDVIHSFFMPVLRIKQDAVPGMQIPLRFQAEKTGNYEIACAELCGLGHYRMRGMLQVMEPEAYASWLNEQEAAAHP
jgi:cytochrome c oxidase subunit II